MLRLMKADDVSTLIKTQGVLPFLRRLTDRLADDFAHWDRFEKSERHATHFPQGVIELMPCSDQQHYSFKYVNGHPGNVAKGLPSILSLGVLASAETGEPLLLAEMGLLTALRTAATAALGARYLVRKDSYRLGIIGTGAQSEFQVMALVAELGIEQVKYFDIDASAMKKFAANLGDQSLELVAVERLEEVLDDIDILVTATADRQKARLFSSGFIQPGLHIHALGGDCPGKTELPAELLLRATLVVEYLPQTEREGEIQNLQSSDTAIELWRLVKGLHPGRLSESEITIFDAVGFALEDFTALNLVYELAEAEGVGEQLDFLASPSDPKDLFSLINNP